MLRRISLGSFGGIGDEEGRNGHDDHDDDDEVDEVDVGEAARRLRSANGDLDGAEGWEEIVEREARFGRQWFYVASTVTAWVVFWELADRHQENVLSRILAWGTVAVAIWAAANM